jgi:hypothetical protein
MRKKKGTIWNYWTVIALDSAKNSNKNKNKHSAVNCNYCSKVFDRGVPTRMQTYLNNDCLGISDNAKSKNTTQIQNLTSNTTKPPSNTPIFETNRPTKRVKSSTIVNFVDCMSEEEQETLEFLLAQALFSTGVPFAFIENPYVIQFFNYLRPSFKLPNRRKIADELLDEVYEEVKMQADEQISKATTLCMVSDGWSNINRESVQNFIICTPKPFFLMLHFQVKSLIQQHGLQTK